MNTLFKKDLYRYYGEHGENLKQYFLRPDEIKYLKYLRFCQALQKSNIRGLFYRLRLKKLSKKHKYKYQ